MQETKDITIIGAGPTGLFAAFYAGMRGASHRLIDNLDQVGGQLTALYPEKYVFDVAGFPKILAKDLVKGMAEQGLQWKGSVHLAQKVIGLKRTEENGKLLFTIVTELVLAFPAGGAGGRSTPPSHVPVVALLDEPTLAGGGGSRRAQLTRAAALDLVNRVAQRAESVTRGTPAMLLRPLSVDPDQAADAGEVVALESRYAVGFRARYVTAATDTMLVTGVAATDVELRELRWVIRPLRVGLRGGRMRPPARRPAVRYSVRGAVAGAGGGMLLLLDEIADVLVRDSRTTAVDPVTRRVLAAQPLALRCP